MRLRLGVVAACLVFATTALGCGGDEEGPGAGEAVSAQLIGRIEGTPTDVVETPNGERLFVAAQDGLVFQWLRTDDGMWEPDPDPVLDRRDVILSSGEAGLLGLAVPDDGALLVTSSVRPTGELDLHAHDLTDEGHPDDVDPRLVATIDRPIGGHYGGDLEYDAATRALYWSTGDGGSGQLSQPDQAGTAAFGAVVRLSGADLTGTAPLVPSEHLVAIGLRNPWRLSFDAATGELWISDVGESSTEEVNVLDVSDPGSLDRAADFGWPALEGTEVFREDLPKPSDPIAPVHERAHDESTCAIVGVGRYRGTRLPQLTGSYLFGDYCSQELLALDPDDPEAGATVVTTLPERLVSAGSASDGEVFLLGVEGGVYELRSSGEVDEELARRVETLSAPTNDEALQLSDSEIAAWCTGERAFGAMTTLGSLESPEEREELLDKAVVEMRTAVPELPADLQEPGYEVLRFLEELRTVLADNGWSPDADAVIEFSDGAVAGVGDWSGLGAALAAIQAVDVECPGATPPD